MLLFHHAQGLTAGCLAFADSSLPDYSVPAAVHVIAATPPATCPMAEFLVRGQPAAQHFHTRFMHPEGGSIALPEAPGLGLEIDETKVESRRE